MPKIVSGDPIPNIILSSIDGKEYDISSANGKRIILTFYRFETCPFCNIKRWSEFNEETVMIGIFMLILTNCQTQ
ncbi:MAG: redoxin domain-containing protein [Euryarchaeota archaeon]|nr:redoxin domain-containing protein [Euryarchaeota archaeon]